jgi:hypothetical protein
VTSIAMRYAFAFVLLFVPFVMGAESRGGSNLFRSVFMWEPTAEDEVEIRTRVAVNLGPDQFLLDTANDFTDNGDEHLLTVRLSSVVIEWIDEIKERHAILMNSARTLRRWIDALVDELREHVDEQELLAIVKRCMPMDPDSQAYYELVKLRHHYNLLKHTRYEEQREPERTDERKAMNEHGEFFFD